MRFAFIDQYDGQLSQSELCGLLEVTDRGYRSWRGRPISQRQRDDLVILAHIREQHRLSLGTYGRPRMTEELQEQGLEVGHRRVGRLMQQNGIKVVRTHKYKATTDSAHNFKHCSELVGSGLRRNCTQSEVGRRYQLYLDPSGLAVSGSGH